MVCITAPISGTADVQFRVTNTLQTRQSCPELGEGKTEPLAQVLHGQAWLVKTAEKPANRILITFFKLQMGFREDATTVELQT